jgi:hypothetical protein
VTGGRTRYPGAQPFADDAVSRAVFFGREKEAARLVDQILAHRLVVVYAKSGLGKTSLVQAGVAQPLRDEGYIPLFVRVNDVKQGPLRSLPDFIRQATAGKPLEYNPGSTVSLWHFFKTTEFWQRDRLLTPVLVLDQFEELFTLHTSETRAAFLRELGYLVRGVRPERSDAEATLDASLSDAPPEMRIVISLREDYLGSLEEAADNIPQILDHRFRLTPLSVDAAVTALEGPARVQDPALGTQPFAYRPDTVRSILTYLTQRTGSNAARAANTVEPFHLQLICQRVESLVAERQRKGSGTVEISLADLGGERGLASTLRDFYRNVIATIDPRGTRKKARRLCEQYLISPEGRRLSLEQGEIRRILRLEPATLRQLVDRRLLRSDQRADNWYYELSHDSLVAPILATRKTQGITFGILGLVLSLVAALTVITLAIIFWLFLFTSLDPAAEDAVGIAVIILILVLVLAPLSLWMCVLGIRRSVEMLNRYISPPA